MAQIEPTLPPAFSESKERKIIFLLCVLAAVHVFIFSAAFPFFNNTDEPIHFDLVVKYSHGHIPRTLEPLSTESAQYLALYSSMAYFGKPDSFPGGKFPPPPWTQSIDQVRQYLVDNEAGWKKVTNYGSSHPPLYYALAGLWWRIGQWCGLEGGHLLYWTRFLNIPLVALLVWMGYVAARIIFPEQSFLRLGVPSLLAFIPQTAFYSIENDMLSPLCFGAAFICLVNFFNTEIPRIWMGAATGLALAATFLTKAVNVPLLAVAVLIVSLKILRLAKIKKIRATLFSLTALALCAGIPSGLWMIWCEHNFGDLTGSAVKIQYWGIVHKPFGEWWSHPIFTPQGLWTFVSGLLSTFWQGEFWWHDQPMTFPAIGVIYTVLSIGLVVLALMNLCSQHVTATVAQRQTLWFSFLCFITLVVFWGFQSIIYDFHDCPNPTREHPYFTTGRYLLGALIPFLLLFVYGIDRMLCGIKNNWARPLVLSGIILLMLVSEVITAWPAFSNEYNWFHM